MPLPCTFGTRVSRELRPRREAAPTPSPWRGRVWPWLCKRRVLVSGVAVSRTVCWWHGDTEDEVSAAGSQLQGPPASVTVPWLSQGRLWLHTSSVVLGPPGPGVVSVNAGVLETAAAAVIFHKKRLCRRRPGVPWLTLSRTSSLQLPNQLLTAASNGSPEFAKGATAL